MITAQIELYSDCIEEMKPLFVDHWKELGIYQDKMPLDPNYALYQFRQNQNELVMPTIRENGKIIGYWPTFITNGLHYNSTLTASMDILYIHPDHRGSGAGKMLFECLRDELKRRGVKIWYTGSKNHKQIEWFLKMMGFDPVETCFAMWLGD